MATLIITGVLSFLVGVLSGGFIMSILLARATINANELFKRDTGADFVQYVLDYKKDEKDNKN